MQKATSKDRLFESAVQLIANGGLHNFDLRKVVKEAGTSSARFRDYFKSRDQMLYEIFDSGWESIHASVNPELMKASTAPSQRLTSIVRGILNAFKKDGALIQATLLIGLSTVGWPLREELRKSQHFCAFFESLNEYKRQFFQSGLITGEKASEEAEVFSEFVMGGISRLLYLMTPVGGRSEVWNSEARQRAIIAVMERVVSEAVNIRTCEMDEMGIPSSPF